MIVQCFKIHVTLFGKNFKDINEGSKQAVRQSHQVEVEESGPVTLRPILTDGLPFSAFSFLLYNKYLPLKQYRVAGIGYPV